MQIPLDTGGALSQAALHCLARRDTASTNTRLAAVEWLRECARYGLVDAPRLGSIATATDPHVALRDVVLVAHARLARHCFPQRTPVYAAPSIEALEGMLPRGNLARWLAALLRAGVLDATRVRQVMQAPTAARYVSTLLDALSQLSREPEQTENVTLVGVGYVNERGHLGLEQHAYPIARIAPRPVQSACMGALCAAVHALNRKLACFLVVDPVNLVREGGHTYANLLHGMHSAFEDQAGKGRTEVVIDERVWADIEGESGMTRDDLDLDTLRSVGERIVIDPPNTDPAAWLATNPDDAWAPLVRAVLNAAASLPPRPRAVRGTSMGEFWFVYADSTSEDLLQYRDEIIGNGGEGYEDEDLSLSIRIPETKAEATASAACLHRLAIETRVFATFVADVWDANDQPSGRPS